MKLTWLGQLNYGLTLAKNNKKTGRGLKPDLKKTVKMEENGKGGLRIVLGFGESDGFSGKAFETMLEGSNN